MHERLSSTGRPFLFTAARSREGRPFSFPAARSCERRPFSFPADPRLPHPNACLNIHFVTISRRFRSGAKPGTISLMDAGGDVIFADISRIDYSFRVIESRFTEL